MRNRKSNRLKGFDYSFAGYYFVTICVHHRMNLFGTIVGGRMVLNEWGQIAHNCWHEIPKIFLNVTLDTFVVMPNHVHGIIQIRRGLIHQTQTNDEGMINHAPTESWRLMQKHDISLGKIIRHFKAKTTKLIHNQNYTFVWQRNYYDRIIRDERELNHIRQYIINNPIQWDTDVNNPLVNPCL